MIKLRGQEAYSSTELARWLLQIQGIAPHVTQVHAEYVYFIETNEALDAQERAQLDQLVETAQTLKQLPEETVSFLVIPRIGTISPWASKATEIAQHCGLSKVTRIERGTAYSVVTEAPLTEKEHVQLKAMLHDRMTQSVVMSDKEADALFLHEAPRPLHMIPYLEEGRSALVVANKSLGLALSEDEINYLEAQYKALERNPSDVELMMFSQVNSEHCRHKIFRAHWVVDGQEKDRTLFGMIKHTHASHPEHTRVAYHDNAAVIDGHQGQFFYPNIGDRAYGAHSEAMPIVIKVETHNHPTAISPFPGAATGTGGEIRDEAATGRGAKTKAGLVGFAVSNLNIPGFEQPWEKAPYGQPEHIASALDIMIDAPLGASQYGNEFGRPNLCGYFRTYENNFASRHWGYHKPIMLAGGIGHIREVNLYKESLPVQSKVVVLGGPAMLIGLGGGAASSMQGSDARQSLDFASVQRGNAEMERRCQEVIDQCWALGEKNPILAIHDVGAGGLSNAVPELVNDAGRGARVDLSLVPSLETGLSPLELWCNESQERYVLAVDDARLFTLKSIAEREYCPCAVIGEVTEEANLVVTSAQTAYPPVDIPLSLLFGYQHEDVREASSFPYSGDAFSFEELSLEDAAQRVLQLPTVADKSFLITIGDRSVGGRTARDQMVGPWQTPVADAAVTLTDYWQHCGEAMALGERPPIALLDAAASARMAVGEALTNLCSSDIVSLERVRLSANWMAAASIPGEAAKLYQAVEAVGQTLCPQLAVSIPVGKDSLSMTMRWQDLNREERQVTSPLSLSITAVGPVADVRNTWTPVLVSDQGPTDLVVIDLGKKKNRLGGSCLAQVYQAVGSVPPDLDSADTLRHFFEAMQVLHQEDLVLAYHDRSDGGLFVTLCEMAFAGHVGFHVSLDALGDAPVPILFSEELGAVLQVRNDNTEIVLEKLESLGLGECSFVVGELNATQDVCFDWRNETIYSNSRVALQRWWSETSYRMCARRENAETAQQAYDQLLDEKALGLSAKITFEMPTFDASVMINTGAKPKAAILREQGVNGHIEMAAAFHHAGFESVDVHMRDLLAHPDQLQQMNVLAVCGGFSYGDVLGAGRGWATSILDSEVLSGQFRAFFEREQTLTLGVCNGCQMLSHLASLIPGAAHWPVLKKNVSQQFEARFVMVEVQPSSSIFMQGMAHSQLPVVVSHGEGRAFFEQVEHALQLRDQAQVVLRYVDYQGSVTENYPLNPNGSPEGLTGWCSQDGRVTLMMPHPERVFRAVQCSWSPEDWGEYSPWMKMFQNAHQQLA